MILGQTAPYLRRKDLFTNADRWGASVARHELVRAALRSGVVEGVHFFVPPPLMSWKPAAEALAELQDDFPHHVLELRNQDDLGVALRERYYVFVDSMLILPDLAHARQALHKDKFPITGITHSIPSPADTMQFLGMFMFVEPYDTIVATSEAGRRAIESIFAETGRFLKGRLNLKSLQFPHVVKIPLGVDEQFLSPLNTESCRLALGLPRDNTIILYIGRLTEKGKADLEPLFAAFHRLSLRHSNLHLLIAGKDSQDGYSHELQHMASRLCISESVTILKDFTLAQKPLLYSACDIFISPVDNIQETFGLSILEAMSAGVPIVASDWSGYRDLVKHEDCGFLARTIWNNEASNWASRLAPSWRDGSRIGHFLAQSTVVDIDDLCRYVEVLCENRELRKIMGIRGRERVLKEFCWPAVIMKYSVLWEDQLARMRNMTSNDGPPVLSLNYEEIYGHFATTLLREVVDFKLSSIQGRGCLPIMSGEIRAPFGISLTEAQRIRDMCQRRPQSIEALLAGGRKETACTLAWLWKKGYLGHDV